MHFAEKQETFKWQACFDTHRYITYVRKVSITREILACNVSNLLSKLNMVWRVSICILQRNKRRSSGKRASIHIDILRIFEKLV